MATLVGTAGAIQAPPASASVLGQGVAYPLQLDANTGRLKLSWGSQSVMDSVAAIVQTQIGERVMLPDYGASSVTFDPIDLHRLKAVLEKNIADYEPRALNVSVEVEPGRPGEVNASTSFTVAGEASPRTLTYPLFVGP